MLVSRCPEMALTHAYCGRSLEEAVTGARKPLVASAWSEQDAKCATGLQRLHTDACKHASQPTRLALNPLCLLPGHLLGF